ncbi:MAG TPA: cyanophycin synthetase, partial [Coriobacteriia bacterium]
PDAARAALAAMRFPGRFELVAGDPPIVLDGAHNPQAAAVLAEAIGEAWPDPERRPVCVLGVLADKDAEGIVRALAPVVSGFVCTQPPSPRARAACALAAVVERVAGAPTGIEPDLMAALDAASAATACGVVVTGSLYAVGGMRTSLMRRISL